MKGRSTFKTTSAMVLSPVVASGHLRAADALVTASEAKAVSARQVEVLRYTNRVFRRIYSDLYVELMSRGPDLLGWIYKTLDRP